LNKLAKEHLPKIDVKKLRRASGLSQIEFSRKVGLSQAFISKIEKEGGNPSRKSLRKIIEGLNLTLKQVENICSKESDKHSAILYLTYVLSKRDIGVIRALTCLIEACPRNESVTGD
jgi:transcriptional regulator with XRE-family HTH domain